MKHRSTLLMMEQLVMIAVFALAAAVCLQVFLRADQISRETALRDQAVGLAQQAAETLKSCRGDPEETAEDLGGVVQEGILRVTEGTLTLEIVWEDSHQTGLGTARIRVCREGAEPLFSLTAGWQEVIP